MDPLLEFLGASGLQDGDRLPPERELAARLGISRRALRQQLLALELDGRIWRGVGQGTFLGLKPIGSETGLVADPSQFSPHVILDARLRFEPVIAATAAVRATPYDLSVIENCVRKNAEATDDDSWSRWDSAFHRAVGSATRNPISLALTETLIAARRQQAWGDIRRAQVDKELRRQSADDHRQILAALQSRDPDAAMETMRLHLQNIARMLKIEIVA
ncbi:FadR/GntR family transcriptional regulator [Jiella sp. M17.18]|uniref:FadR/GntR family transcriptional regulator n=1 Tax=Jiella sp. M17.18 TaxID=3234247 RepID=UPI0034E0022B